MNIFLIDYENVNVYGFIGTEFLKKHDRVYIFYSNKTQTIKTEIVDNLTNKKIFLKLFKLSTTGKNALDFQLTFYLGSLVKKFKKDAKYYIISKDNGYQSVIDFAKINFKVNIIKANNIDEAINGEKPKLLLLENNPVHTSNEISKPTPEVISSPKEPLKNPKLSLSSKEKRNKIYELLKSNSIISYRLLDNQCTQISAILVDETKKTQELATEYIGKCVGLKNLDLIPIILNCCREYLLFDLENNPIKVKSKDTLDLVSNTKFDKNARRVKILKVLNSNDELTSQLTEGYINNIAITLSDSGKNMSSIAGDYIAKIVGKKYIHLVPRILEFCKDFIRE